MYSSERPEYLNYASVATVIGHEIMHAFDAADDFSEVWSARTTSKRKFEERIKCLVNQYGDLTETHMQINVI